MLSWGRSRITDAGIIPGIKVDTAAKDLAVIPDEN
jgi:fructose-bisphosphate aldolase class 1